VLGGVVDDGTPPFVEVELVLLEFESVIGRLTVWLVLELGLVLLVSEQPTMAAAIPMLAKHRHRFITNLLIKLFVKHSFGH